MYKETRKEQLERLTKEELIEKVIVLHEQLDDIGDKTPGPFCV